jgi:hypothetical protein
VVEMDFHLLGDITDVEPIAANLSIRERKNLKVRFGGPSLAETQGGGAGAVPER